MGFRFVTQEFFPVGDRNQYLIYIDLPAGAHVGSTVDAMERLTAWLSDPDVNPEVASNVGYVGSGGPRFFLSLSPLDADSHVGFVVVTLQDHEQVPEMVRRTRDLLLAAFPNVNGQVTLDEVEDDVLVRLTNGGIAADLRIEDDEAIDLLTVNGNVDLAIPTSTNALLSIALANGTISVTNLTVSNQSSSNTTLNGTLGTGEGAITLRTTNGNISLLGF